MQTVEAFGMEEPHTMGINAKDAMTAGIDRTITKEQTKPMPYLASESLV